MRAIVAHHLVIAVTALVLGCSSSPTEVSDPPTRLGPAPDQPIHRLTVTPGVATISAGKAIRLTAMNELGAALVSSEVSWTSLNPEIATVDANGLVRGQSRGQARILARWNAALVSVQIVVTKGVPDEGSRK